MQDLNEHFDEITREEVREPVMRRQTPTQFATAVDGTLAAEVAAWCDRVASEEGKPGLLLMGTTGVGKTWQAYAAAWRLYRLRCHVMRATTEAALYQLMRPSSGSEVSPEAWERRFREAQVLVLDDLGSARQTEWAEEKIGGLIDHRYARGLPTIVTTNMPIEVPPKSTYAGPLLAQAVGERVVSRLYEMCDRIALRGSDRRRDGSKTVYATA